MNGNTKAWFQTVPDVVHREAMAGPISFHGFTQLADRTHDLLRGISTLVEILEVNAEVADEQQDNPLLLNKQDIHVLHSFIRQTADMAADRIGEVAQHTEGRVRKRGTTGAR